MQGPTSCLPFNATRTSVLRSAIHHQGPMSCSISISFYYQGPMSCSISYSSRLLPGFWSATSQCLALQLNWYRHPVTQSCYLLLCQYTSWTYYNAVTLAALIKYTQLWLRFIKCRYLGIVICIPQGIAFQLILPHPVGSQFSIIVRLIPKDVNPHQFDSSHRMLIVISFNLCA